MGTRYLHQPRCAIGDEPSCCRGVAKVGCGGVQGCYRPSMLRLWQNQASFMSFVLPYSSYHMLHGSL